MSPAADVLGDLRQKYRQRLHDNDPVVAAVAQEALERLNTGARQARRQAHRPRHAEPESSEPHRWAFALEQIITDSGNAPIRWRRDGSYDTSHQPRHPSKSGTCLWVHPRSGYWWCRSCERSGDALEWVKTERGISFPVAYAYLLERFGVPFRKSA
jgi:hypothetical protein